jgi:hypothetical protein
MPNFRRDPKQVRRLKISQFQNRRREDLTKLVSNSITSCPSYVQKEGNGVPMVAISTRNVRDVSSYIVTEMISRPFLKRHVLGNLIDVLKTPPFLTLSNYSGFYTEKTTKKITEWMNSQNFIRCFGYDYYHCCGNYNDFSIGFGHTDYYRNEYYTYKNEFQWFFSLYTEWKNAARCPESKYYLMEISSWFNAEPRLFPMPLPSKKGFRWFKVEELLRHVYRNIIEKYETDLNPQPILHDVLFSNYFSTLWLKSHFIRTPVNTQMLQNIVKCFPFPDKIVIKKKRYFRLLSLNGMMRLLLINLVSCPGSSLTMKRVCSRNLLRYLTGGEYLLYLNSNFNSFQQYWARLFSDRYF